MHTRFNFDFQDFLFRNESERRFVRCSLSPIDDQILLNIWTFIAHLFLHHLELKRDFSLRLISLFCSSLFIPVLDPFESCAFPFDNYICVCLLFVSPLASHAQPRFPSILFFSVSLFPFYVYFDEIAIVNLFQCDMEIHSQITSTRYMVIMSTGSSTTKMEEIAEEANDGEQLSVTITVNMISTNLP